MSDDNLRDEIAEAFSGIHAARCAYSTSEWWEEELDKLTDRILEALKAAADADVGVYKGTREQAIRAGIAALRGDDG